ncbi:hypothetical protein BHE74_00039146 [Ensete ventricosum]|nr:hypothetical protein BHE74_00039146 [Ensete ventricosum]RZR76269.1 hypothetical protein BHM03_00000952 [Ensete ventricosum]
MDRFWLILIENVLPVWSKSRNAILGGTTRIGWYVLVRQLTGTRTALYRVVLPIGAVSVLLPHEIDRQWPISGGISRGREKEEEGRRKTWIALRLRYPSPVGEPWSKCLKKEKMEKESRRRKRGIIKGVGGQRRVEKQENCHAIATVLATNSVYDCLGAYLPMLLFLVLRSAKGVPPKPSIAFPL